MSRPNPAHITVDSETLVDYIENNIKITSFSWNQYGKPDFEWELSSREELEFDDTEAVNIEEFEAVQTELTAALKTIEGLEAELLLVKQQKQSIADTLVDLVDEIAKTAPSITSFVKGLFR